MELIAQRKEVEDFLFEATTMKKFDHPNILPLIGISLCEEKPCAVVPLMHLGDLKSYLMKHKKVKKFVQNM